LFSFAKEGLLRRRGLLALLRERGRKGTVAVSISLSHARVDAIRIAFCGEKTNRRRKQKSRCRRRAEKPASATTTTMTALSSANHRSGKGGGSDRDVVFCETRVVR